MKKTFIRKGIFACIAAILGIASSFAQTAITTGAVTPNTVCAGGSVTVAYTSTGTVTAGTVFSAEISDATGTFPATPNVIGTGTASPINAVIPNAAASGTAYKIRVTTTTPAVVGDPGSAFTINAIPAAPTVVTPVNYAVGAVSTQLPAITNGVWYEVVTGGSGSGIAPTPATGTAGTKSYFVSQKVGDCEGPRSEIKVIVTCSTTAPTVVTPVNYNVGAAATQLPAVTNGLWYDAVTGGVGSATAPTPVTTVAGTTSYFVSQTVNGCEGPRAEIKVVVTCATPAPTVVTPVNYNVGATPTQLPAVANGLWYSTVTGGVGSATAPTPTATAVGTTSYFVSQTQNGCEGPRAEIKVVVGACATPAPTVVTPVNYNVGATPTPLPAVANGLWYTAVTGGVGSPTAPTPTATTVGTTSYFVSQTQNGCEGPRAEIKVVVTCATPAPTVVSPVNYSVGATPTQLPTAAGYLWYSAVAGGVGSATAPTPTATAVGTTSYFVSQTQNGCEGPRAEIKVVVGACATPAPTVVTPVNYNVGATPAPLPAVANGLWYTAVTGGVGSPTAPTPAATVAGTTSYFVSQTQNGCEGPRAEIKVVVTCATPAPAVVSPVNYSVGATPTQLPTAAGYLWYSAVTGGVGSATAPTPTATAVGTTSYFVSQTQNGCEGPRAEIKVVVGACATPAPTVVTPVNYSVGATPTPLPAVTNGLWYTAVTGGVGSATAPTPTATVAGTTSYFVSQTQNGCEGPRAEIKVVVTCATPAPTVVSPVSYTVGAAASALTATGTNLKWYAAVSGGTALASAPVPSTSVASTTSFFVSQTVNNCEGPRAEIIVSVVSCATAAPTVISQLNYCLNSTALQLTATGTALKWYSTASGGTALASAPTPSTASSGTTSYFVSQTLNGCEGARAEIKVTVMPETPKPSVISTVNYCFGETASALTATGTGLKWYAASSGGTALASAPTPPTTASGTTSYFVSQTLNGCEGPRAEITVTVKAEIAKPTITSATVNYCFGETASVLTATGTALKWYAASSGGTALASAPIPSTAASGTTSFFVSQTLDGCEGPRAEIIVTVKAEIAKPVVSASTIYCFGETASALTATGTGLKWYAASSGGTALASAPTPTTTVAATTSYFVSQTVNGCEGARAEIKVTVNPVTPIPTVSNTSVTYCFNQTSVVLSATGTGLKWYAASAGGTALASAPTPSTTASGTTSYFVSQTLNNCESARAEIKVTVAAPVALPTIVGSSTIEYCQSVKASALSATALSGNTLNWYGTNATGGTASSVAPVPSTDTEGTITYYVGQTDANGCLSARAGISVKTNVTPKPALATSSVAYCQNETASALVATGTNLKWYLTIDDTAPRTTALTPFTEKVSDYSFYVTQTGTNNCESAKAEIKVHIKPLPSATISGNASIALGGTANILVNFTGDAPWKYILSNGNTGTTSNASLSIAVSPNVTTTYSVTEVSNSCGKGIINGSALVTVQVPTLTIGVPSVSESCAGKTFTVQFQQSGSFPDGSTMKAQISTVNETSKFITVPSVINGSVVTATIPDTTKSGAYYVRIANIAKDGTLISAGNVSSGQITVRPLPVATISGTTTIYKGAIANLKVDLTGDAPWTFSLNNGTIDSLISTSVNPITVRVAPQATTTYTVSTVSNQCGIGRGAGTARIQVDPVLGTEPPVVAADWLKIYPTLVDDKVTVEITSAVSAKEAGFEILDLNGRSLFKKTINQKITEVDFTQRPAGLYLLKVQNGKYNSVQRILKP